MACLNSVSGSARFLFVNRYTGNSEELEGRDLVYVTIEDSTGLIANINVDRAELLAALGVS